MVYTTHVWPAALDFTFSSNFSVVTELQTISDNYYASHFTTSHSLNIKHWWVLSILNLIYSRKYTTVNLFYIIVTPLLSRHCREEDAPAKCVTCACMHEKTMIINLRTLIRHILLLTTATVMLHHLDPNNINCLSFKHRIIQGKWPYCLEEQLVKRLHEQMTTPNWN